MKKTIVLIMFTLLLVNFITYAENDQVIAEVIDFKVTVNDYEIDVQHSQYPLIKYKNITYFPMTQDLTSGINLSVKWDSEKGLDIVQSDQIRIMHQDYLGAYNKLGSKVTASIPNFPITINGTLIDNTSEEYPILHYKNITYFPLTWRFAHSEFGWDYRYSSKDGLSIRTKSYKPIKEIQVNIEDVTLETDKYLVDCYFNGEEYMTGYEEMETSKDLREWTSVSAYPKTFSSHFKIYPLGQNYILLPTSSTGYSAREKDIKQIFYSDVDDNRISDILVTKDLVNWKFINGGINDGTIFFSSGSTLNVYPLENKVLLSNPYNIYEVKEDFTVNRYNYSFDIISYPNRIIELMKEFWSASDWYYYKDYFYVRDTFNHQMNFHVDYLDGYLVDYSPVEIIMRSKDGIHWEEIYSDKLTSAYGLYGDDSFFFEDGGSLYLLTDSKLLSTVNGTNWKVNNNTTFKNNLIWIHDFPTSDYIKSAYDKNRSLETFKEKYVDISKFTYHNGFYCYFELSYDIDGITPRHVHPQPEISNTRMIITKDFRTKLVIDDYQGRPQYLESNENYIIYNNMVIDLNKVNDFLN